MKIAFALPYLQRGYGIEHRTTHLAKLLPADVERVLLCLAQTGPVDASLRVVRLTGWGPVSRRMVGPLYHWSPVFRLASLRYLPYLRSDWIVDAQYHPLTSLRPRGGLVVTWYSVPPVRYAGSAPEAARWMRDRAAMLRAARRSDLVFCISHALEEEIRDELGGSVRTEVLPIGCDPARGSAPLQREQRRVLSIGRFARHKCHEDTILAFDRARRALARQKLELLLIGTVGDPAYLKLLRSVAASVGLREGKNIHFIRDASDRTIGLALGISDIFVSSSRWEGFGMPLAEAQAAGLPAIAYDLWSHPEVVAEPENRVSEGDVEGMAERMINLLSDTSAWQKASAKAQSFARANFAWERIVERYTKLLREL